MKRRLARTIGTTCTAAVVAALAASHATAAPRPPAAQAPASAQPADPMLRAVQRDLGLTAAQAKQRLVREATANTTNQQLQSSLAGTYGGAHFDARSGQLVVGVTDPTAFDQVRSSGAQPVLVQHSSEQLESTADALSNVQAPSSVSGWYVDPVSNKVVITTARGTAPQAQEFATSAGADPSAVRVAESAERPRPVNDVVGGNGYTVNNAARCSIGFSVEGGFVSAGHCGKTGDHTTTPNGTVTDSRFPGNDYLKVQTDPAATPQPVVNNYQGGTVPIAGSTEAAVGTSVCRSGATSGWHCGTIQAKDQSVRYPEGEVSGLTRTDVCAEPGDSGGPFVAGDQAQGTTSGGSGDCTSGGTTYFQPLNPVLQATNSKLLTKQQ